MRLSNNVTLDLKHVSARRIDQHHQGDAIAFRHPGLRGVSLSCEVPRGFRILRDRSGPLSRDHNPALVPKILLSLDADWSAIRKAKSISLVPSTARFR